MDKTVTITDSGQGEEIVSLTNDIYFFVTSENVLLPFGVYVSRDSEEEILPETRDISEEVPGRHGEIDFGTDYKARLRELACRTPDGLSKTEMEDLKQMLAQYLDPTFSLLWSGSSLRKLVYESDIRKAYMVKFSGKLQPKNYPDWFEFTIPFKMPDPFIIGNIEKTIKGRGSGSNIILRNDGNYFTALNIRIDGPVTENPSITFVDQSWTIEYEGEIEEGEYVLIDATLKTAKKINEGTQTETNVYSDAAIFFDSMIILQGDTVITASENITLTWRDKWI